MWSRRSTSGALPRDYFDHIKEKDVRNELSVEAETENFQYVLVFDDSAFVMKSINRILKVKNIKGPAMVTRCQRLAHINEHADRKLAVLLVSADDSVVYQQAQKMQLMV